MSQRSKSFQSPLVTEPGTGTATLLPGAPAGHQALSSPVQLPQPSHELCSVASLSQVRAGMLGVVKESAPGPRAALAPSSTPA